MITQLNIPAPPARQLQAFILVELVAPLVATERYFGLVRRAEGESFVCAVIHPYSTAYMYASAFPALLPLLREEVLPARQMSEVTWADIAYTSPDSARPQLLVRTARLASAAADVVWQDRDQKYARSWETRVWPIMHLLDRIRPDRLGPDAPNAELPGDNPAAPAPVEGSLDGR
jgi:hypothetical protein